MNSLNQQAKIDVFAFIVVNFEQRRLKFYLLEQTVRNYFSINLFLGVSQLCYIDVDRSSIGKLQKYLEE